MVSTNGGLNQMRAGVSNYNLFQHNPFYSLEVNICY